ncbi:MAG: hypothetical protein EBX46_06500, partial [Burkholderiaceae bacterium]|nr:hypothetical protein [Burkholderiaceae bacterium]
MRRSRPYCNTRSVCLRIGSRNYW